MSVDLVNKPPHYTGGDIECIDAIRASMSLEEFQGFLKGNVIKYTWRYRDKGGAQDLGKAQYYLKKLLESYQPAKPEAPLGAIRQQVNFGPLIPNMIPTVINPPSNTVDVSPAIEAQPAPQLPPALERMMCRNYLQKAGLAYPRSNCRLCGSVFSGAKCKYPDA